MTRTTSTAEPVIRPRTSTLDRPTLMRLAATEYDRFAGELRELDVDDWTRPTECPGWDVRTMASHVLGMAEMAASVRVGIRQQKAAKKRCGVFIDALTAVQVDERVDMSPAQLTARMQVVGPQAGRARRRTPGFIRRRLLPIPQLVGDQAEDWTLGFLIDTILTRDTWMHRIDIARATGRPLALTMDHDGAIVADVVTEWAARHGAPCSLELTGPAGGTWIFGSGGLALEADAIEFCRTLSGRVPGTGLAAVQIPF